MPQKFNAKIKELFRAQYVDPRLCVKYKIPQIVTLTHDLC